MTDILLYDPTPFLYAKMKEADGCGLFSFMKVFQILSVKPCVR